MKLKFLGVLLLVALMADGAFAVGPWNWDACCPPGGGLQAAWNAARVRADGGVFNWNIGVPGVEPPTPSNSLPDGADETRIRGSGVVVTLNSNEVWTCPGALANRGRMRVYGDATLNIVEGSLQNVGWLRVGESSGGAGTTNELGYVNQSGGLVTLAPSKDKGKIGIGDTTTVAGSYYAISGGTITYTAASDGQLYVGSRGGIGKFVVQGTAPVISLKNLYVSESGYAAQGTLEYDVGAGGVSAIQCLNTPTLDQGTGTANLVLTLTAAIGDPLAPIVLVKNASASAVLGTFDRLNGVIGAATEGAPVVLSFGGTNYGYKLTYLYNADGGAIGNDIALIPEPATLALLSLGLIAIRRRK